MNIELKLRYPSLHNSRRISITCSTCGHEIKYNEKILIEVTKIDADNMSAKVHHHYHKLGE